MSDAEGPTEPRFNSRDARVWPCGNPQHSNYKYSMPDPPGDRWERLLNPLLKKDKLQCDAWKEEVQNLLIFAGLFSAVVTAFVIDSYKGLQPDSGDTVVNLLSRIAARLDNDPLNSTATPLTPPPFSPTHSTIRLNTYWFLSLILSLTTVLLGIISLQWLREHQLYHGITPKQSYAIYHMRAEALQKWYVPQIFASLPLLLQAALILFFIGIIEFLLSLGYKVAIPVIVVITLTLLFLLATTLLPSLQALPLWIPSLRVNKFKAPAQCPYKSPQSHAFRALSGVVFWLSTKFLLAVFFSRKLTISVPIYNNHDQVEDEDGSADGQQDNNQPQWLLNLEDVLVVWSRKTWMDFDLAWLDVRDNYLTTDRGIRAATTFPLHVPLYDLVHGLGNAVKTHGVEDSDVFVSAVYRCFQEIAQNTHDVHHWQYPYQLHLQTLVKRFLKRGVYVYISDLLASKDVNLLYDENNLAFLNIMVKNRNLEKIIPKSAHFHELQLRVLGYFATHQSEFNKDLTGPNTPTIVKFEHPGLDPDWDKPKLEAFVMQWATILYYFFATFEFVKGENPSKGFHTHSYLPHKFASAAIQRLKYAHDAGISPAVISDCLLAVIENITKNLRKFTAAGKSSSILYSVADSFSQHLANEYWIPNAVLEALSNELEPTLLERRRFIQNVTAGQKQRQPDSKGSPNVKAYKHALSLSSALSSPGNNRPSSLSPGRAPPQGGGGNRQHATGQLPRSSSSRHNDASHGLAAVLASSPVGSPQFDKDLGYYPPPRSGGGRSERKRLQRSRSPPRSPLQVGWQDAEPASASETSTRSMFTNSSPSYQPPTPSTWTVQDPAKTLKAGETSNVLKKKGKARER